MASASQALYTDPSMAFDIASTPDQAFTKNVMQYTQQQQEADTQQVQQDRSGFLGAISGWLADADATLSKIPGWGVTKQYYKTIFYPVDKAAQGAHWLYSNIVSQPLSTLILQSGKADLENSFSPVFSGSEWSEAYSKAEHISPGQALYNTGLAQVSAGQAPSNFGLPGAISTFTPEAEITDDQKRATERMFYDTEYWRDKVGWKYTAGTGATDFATVLALDPTTYITGGVGQVVKGVRSVQLVNKGGELVRTRGAIADTARQVIGKQPETAEQLSQSGKMQEFFDWVAAPSNVTGAPRKSAAEIEMHPIWGRGRRVNNFSPQYSQALSTWARDDMELGWRFMAGDNNAVTPLMERGGKVLDDIGRLSENRVAVDSTRFDSTILGYFAGEAARRPTVAPEGLDLTAPFTRQTALHQEAGEHLYKSKGVSDVSAIDKASIDTWKESKLNLINGELTRLQAEDAALRKLLGGNLGKEAEDFTSLEATGFGGLPRSYRMGDGSFSNVAASAERRYANKLKDRRGRFTTEGYRNGFYGTPIRIVQSFTDKTPVGRINHNEADSGERVYEMLREVPGLGEAQRADLHNLYMTAGDKVAKSKALQQIKFDVVTHMATNVHGLDGEVARLVSGMVEAKTDETVQKLLGAQGRTYNPGKQAFAGARRENGKTVDYVEDGEGWALAPLAKTQLSQTDGLLPVREIERALGRASGSMNRIRATGGSASDAVKIVADSMNTIWKAGTLLRPAYVPRMLSEELVASAIKFGFLSRIIADGGVGAKNFALNRNQYVRAVRGKGSYTSTVKGLERSIVKIDDPEIIAAVQSRKTALSKELARTADPLKKQEIKSTLDALKISRVKVSSALPAVTARIKMERELMGNLQSELKNAQKRHSTISENLAKPQMTLGGGPGSASHSRSLNAQAAWGEKISRLTERIEDHQNVLDEFTDYYNEIYRVALGATGKRLGEGYFEVAGQKIPQAFSGEWQNPIVRDQISSDSAFASIISRGEAVDMNRMIKSGSWTYVRPDAPNHMQSWTHAINRQFAQDDLFMKVMEDSSGKAARDWLITPAGRQHLHDLGIRARNPGGLVDDIGLVLDKYLPEDTGLRQKILDGDEVTPADLTNAIARSDFPTVHGEEIAEKLAISAKDTASNIVDRVIQKSFQKLSTIPSDIISRHPTYLRFQEGRFKELMKTELSYRASVGKDDALNPGQLQKILEQSDKLARKDMSQLVYDPARTTASEALRFLTPFYSAHADSLARWGGLIAENPRLIGRISQTYNAPVAAGLITDEYGNKVGGDGYVSIVDPSTIQYDKDGAPIPGSGKVIGREFVTMDKRVMHFRAPWKSKGSGDLPIKISAMNTILPGDPWFNPGSGPLVQVAGSQIAKASPRTGDFLQWAKVLPYGPTDTAQAVVPKYIRAAWDAYKGDDPDNEEYQKAYLAIWNKKQMEYQQSGGEAKFSQKDIENEAKHFLYLNVLEAWVFPAQSSNTPLTGTPYQFFVDQLGQMRKADPENYRDNFLAKFGPDYGGFTASLTKSMGIAATVSADDMAEKYKDLISADPDMAQFWVGNVYNGGPFSSSVYQKQLDQNFGASKAREKISAEQAIENSQTDRGWYEYRAAKAALDSMLIRNGFKSYAEKGAEAYVLAKQQLVAGVGQKYPAWESAFSTVDRGKIGERVRSFEMAVQDERLMTDPMRYEMQPLAQYLIGRRQFKQLLNERGLSKLSYDVSGRPSGQAADIGMAWEQFKMGLINSNVAFGDLHNRYLNNDELQ
jgi:hypothetical protein